MSSFSIFLILILIVSFLLVLVIMVQNPKGGGLSSSFGGGDSQQIGGVRKTTDFLDKSTWVLASLLLILILLSNIDSKLLDSNNLETAIPEALSEEIPLEIPVQE